MKQSALQDAKARLREVVPAACERAPQEITVRGQVCGRDAWRGRTTTA